DSTSHSCTERPPKSEYPPFGPAARPRCLGTHHRRSLPLQPEDTRRRPAVRSTLGGHAGGRPLHAAGDGRGTASLWPRPAASATAIGTRPALGRARSPTRNKPLP